MKKIFLTAILLLTACATPQTQPIVSPNAAVTPTLPATEIPTATLSPMELMIQYVDPTMKDTIKTELGEDVYKALSESVGLNGEIKAIDYSTKIGEFNGTIESSSVKVETTADMIFPNIVTAEATDKSGNKIKVVWNMETNNWVKTTEIKTNVMDYGNYTHFSNWKEMIKNGDLDLIMLSQGIGNEAFPEDAEKAKYVIGIKSAVPLIINGEEIGDIYLFLDAVRSDYDMPALTKEVVSQGVFIEGKAPQKNPAVIVLDGEDGQPELVLLPTVLANADGRNVIVKNAMDPRLFQAMMGKFEIDGQPVTYFNEKDGRVSLELFLQGERVRIMPVFPTDNPADWNNLGDIELGTLMHHGYLVNRGFEAHNSAPVELLEGDSTIFNSLPPAIREKINSILEKERSGQFTEENLVVFDDGLLTLEFAEALARNISEVSFSYGFNQTSK